MKIVVAYQSFEIRFLLLQKKKTHEILTYIMFWEILATFAAKTIYRRGKRNVHRLRQRTPKHSHVARCVTRRMNALVDEWLCMFRLFHLPAFHQRPYAAGGGGGGYAWRLRGAANVRLHEDAWSLYMCAISCRSSLRTTNVTETHFVYRRRFRPGISFLQILHASREKHAIAKIVQYRALI